MNDIINNMMERRSVRSYQPKPVERALMEEILNAGAWAPTGMNTQSFRLTGMIDPAKVRKLAETVKKALGLPESDNYDFYGAPAFIIASNERGYNNAMPDCACAMENMMLAAKSLGIATVWINQLKEAAGDQALRNALTELGVPESHDVFSCCAAGYALREAAAPPRKSGVTRIVE